MTKKSKVLMIGAVVGSEALHNSLCLIYVQWKESQ